MMKKFKKVEIDIRWRRLDLATLEDAKRRQRLENSREGESTNSPEVNTFLQHLEPWTQFNHPQPFFLFFYNGILVEILRKVDAPKTEEILTNLIKAEEAPKAFEGETDVVIGFESIWDPEKERAEMEKARNEALEAALAPLFQRYFCLYSPTNKISNHNQVEEFCKLVCVEDKDVEMMSVRMLEAPTSALSMKAVVFALNEIYPEDSVGKLESLREHVGTIDPRALREERLAYITQMLKINVRGSLTITAEHAQLLNTRTKAELPEDFDLTKSKLDDAAEKLLPHLDLPQIWNATRHGLTCLFQGEELKAIFASLLLEVDQAEPLGEEKTNEVLLNILGEEHTLPESIGNLFDLSPIQLAERLADFDVITKEHLRKFETKFDPSSIRDYVNMDLIKNQLEEDSTEKAKVNNDTLAIPDASDAELSLGIYFSLLSSDVTSLIINGYPEALVDFMKQFGDKFSTVQFVVPPPPEFIEILPKMAISSLVLANDDEGFVDFLKQNLGENLKSIEIQTTTAETSEEIQKAFVNFVHQHNISDFSSSWNFTEENATALFSKTEMFRHLRLTDSACVSACLKKASMQVNAALHLTSEKLFSEESFVDFVKFLEAQEEMIPHIKLNGACEIEDASWGKFFALLKEKQGCEHLCLNETSISTESIQLLANLLNENKHIGAVELTKVDPIDVMGLLSKLNTERTFDLMFHFEDEVLRHDEFQQLAQKLAGENEWLCIENL